jgi:hypothetical protein
MKDMLFCVAPQCSSEAGRRFGRKIERSYSISKRNPNKEGVAVDRFVGLFFGAE